MHKRNVVESTISIKLTKADIIKLIEDNFPDEEVGIYGVVANITTTKMTDRTQHQSIMFGKILK